MNLDHLTDDLRAAEGRLGNLRWDLHRARRRERDTRGIEATIAITMREIARLEALIAAIWAAADTLCERICDLARASRGHADEEARLLALLGCSWVNPEEWPYVDAALRMREEPTPEHMTAWVVQREILLADGRVAA